MNPDKTIYIYILILGMLPMFLSCQRQGPADNTKDAGKDNPLGTMISALDQKILYIFQDSKDHYWFGGNDQGVVRYDGDRLTLFTTQDGLAGNQVVGIQEDRLGNIYFDTPQGVSQYDGQKMTTLNILERGSSTNEWKLEPDDLWFRMGWDGTGPYRYDGQGLYHLPLPETDITKAFHLKYPDASFSPYAIYTIYRDRKGAMWFGTGSIGAFRYDGLSLSWLYEDQLQETPGGGSFGIRSIIEDQDGYYWINNARFRFEILADSLGGGAVHPIPYRKSPGVAMSSGERIPEDLYFMSIVEDNEGDLWMTTYSDGVWCNNGTELIHYPVKEGDTNVLLFSIYKDRQGMLWLGTHEAGVYTFNGKNFVKFKP